MSNDQSIRQTLVEKLNYSGCFREPEDVSSVSVFGDSFFYAVEDLDLLPALPQLKSLSIDSPPDTLSAEKLIYTLESIPTLESLSLENFTLTPEIMRGILRLKNIQEVALRDMKYDESTLKFLCWQDHLKSLKFSGAPQLSETFLEILSTLPQLEYLDLTNTDVDELPILYFAEKNLPHIKNLLWHPFYLSGEEIDIMISMKLESLWLELNHMDADYMDLCFLNEFKSLKFLFLGGTNPFDIDIWEYSSSMVVDWNLPELTSLRLYQLPKLEMVDFAGIPHLTSFAVLASDPYEDSDRTVEFRNLDSLRELKVFSIGKMRPDAPIMHALANSPDLEYVNAQASTILKPEDVPYLGSMRNLNEMMLGIDEHVTAQDLEQLSVFPKLNSLRLCYTKANGVVGEFVKKCPHLRTLVVDGQTSDEEVRIFASMPKKYMLSISDCSNLSQESIDTIFSMKELRLLYLTNATVERLEIRDFPHLRTLCTNEWKCLKEAEFANLPFLDELELMCPSLETLKILDLTGLNMLNLQYCPRLSLLWVRNLPKLSCLMATGSHSLDLSYLIRLPGLEKLEMGYEQLCEEGVLETLQELPKLEQLIISDFYEKVDPGFEDDFLGFNVDYSGDEEEEEDFGENGEDEEDEDYGEVENDGEDDDFKGDEDDEDYGESLDFGEDGDEWKNAAFQREFERIQNALPNCNVKVGRFQFFD